MSPRFMSWAYELYKKFEKNFQDEGLGTFRGEKPMSGYYAIMFLMQVCDQLDIYGFIPYKDEDKYDLLSTWYHYFDRAIPRYKSHSFDLTEYIYEILAAKYPTRIRLH